jgi:adenylate cyclase
MHYSKLATSAEGNDSQIVPDSARKSQWEHPLSPVGVASRVTPGIPVPRLAAILAADVVEYVRHMAEDELGTHALFMAIMSEIVEPHIARQGGRLVKSTGDGFVAEFGSAARATWFAVDFQRAARMLNIERRRRPPLEFRVGINLGDVIAEAHDIYGHSVNIAARLEFFADPGGVLVSQSVFAAIRDPGLLFEDVGELSLKHLKETVRGYRVKYRRAPPRKGREQLACLSCAKNEKAYTSGTGA